MARNAVCESATGGCKVLKVGITVARHLAYVAINRALICPFVVVIGYFDRDIMFVHRTSN